MQNFHIFLNSEWTLRIITIDVPAILLIIGRAAPTPVPEMEGRQEQAPATAINKTPALRRLEIGYENN